MRAGRAAAAGLLLFAAVAAPRLTAQEPRSVGERIGEAAITFADFLARRFPGPDRPLLPAPAFLTERGERSVLGDRLQEALAGLLAGRRREEGAADSPPPAALAGEIRILPDRVRVLLRVRAPDGSLREGARADLPLDPPLRALLVPPAGAEPPAAAEVDPFEPDDRPGAEVDAGLRQGASWSRRLTAGDVDRFRFEVGRVGTALVEAASPFPIRLVLFRGAGRVPLLSRTARIETALEPGVYVLEVCAAESGRSGPYELALSVGDGADDRWEPDGSPAQAGLLPAGPAQERVLRPGDRDWVELGAAGPGFYLLSTRGAQADTRITVTGERGEDLLADDNGGPLYNARLVILLGPRRLFACIEGADRLTSGRYGVSLERFEPPVLSPGAASVEIDPRSTPAFFRLRVERDGVYRLSASAADTPAASPVLEVHSLPDLGRLESREPGAYPLARGDYLVRIPDAGQRRLRVRVD